MNKSVLVAQSQNVACHYVCDWIGLNCALCHTHRDKRILERVGFNGSECRMSLCIGLSCALVCHKDKTKTVRGFMIKSVLMAECHMSLCA